MRANSPGSGSAHPPAVTSAQAHARSPGDTDPVGADVIVVGAGPIGLTVALGLGRAGLAVTVLERRSVVRETSRAIGITPASLEILQRYGVADDLVAAGLSVHRAVIHGDRGVVATPGFQAVRSPFPFILTLPQRHTEEILAHHLRRYPSVRVVRDTTVTKVDLAEDGVTVHRTPTTVPQTALHARYLVGCDGKHSTLRRFVSNAWKGHPLPETFAMADISDDTSLGDAAHLYFTREGSVESFPLPGGIRRWIVETHSWYRDAPPGLVQDLVAQRTGVSLIKSREHWRSSFQTERYRSARWYQGNALLAGDAAHVMPPIGGQGMNVGFGDAEHLSDLLILAHRDRERYAWEVPRYEARRQRAFEVAAGRSILGMKIGAAQGTVRSAVRGWVIRGALRGRAADWVMEHFAMIASPYRRSPWRREVETLQRR